MKALIVFLAIVMYCCNLSNCMPSGDVDGQRTPSQNVMDSVALDDRPNFVAFHISIALAERQRNDVIFKPVLETISPEKRAEFSRIPTPANFSTNLLDWTELELVPFKNEHKNDSTMFGAKVGIHDVNVMNVCFPNGCVEAHDAGELCCPF